MAVFPLKDENPRQNVPLVTWSLIAANVVFFGFQLFGGLDTMTWGMVPQRITADAVSTETYATVFSSMFMHGGLMHLAGNVWFLHIFGDNLEDRIGRFRFLAFYLVCGIGAAVAQIMIDPSSPIPMVGASGAISGILAGYALYFPRAKILSLVVFAVIAIPAFVYIFIWFAMQIYHGMSSRIAGVAWFAHIGGFVAGLLLIAPSWWNRRRVQV